jgi:photosynthetic reaction center cytochrome c subunit
MNTRPVPGFAKLAFAFGLVLLNILAPCIRLGQAQSPGQRPTPDPSKPAEAVYKNIKVLKATPSDQVLPAMQFMSASLGVQCEFCHVEGKFDAEDKKPKQTARDMMQMMFAINKNNFEGHREITCYSCHRGTLKPIAIPVISETPAMPQGEAAEASRGPATNLPAANEILDKYVKALGGAAAIEKVSSRVQQGTAHFGGYQSPIEIY